MILIERLNGDMLNLENAIKIQPASDTKFNAYFPEYGIFWIDFNLKDFLNMMAHKSSGIVLIKAEWGSNQ